MTRLFRTLSEKLKKKMKPNAAIIAFTEDGARLAQNLAQKLPCTETEIYAPPLGCSLKDWAARVWKSSQALIFISAAGIAVRAIAPLLQDKTKDPAVVVLDDAGKHVISLLSGHIGGANNLAQKIAAITGGYAVITTATDTHCVTAIDNWAKDNGYGIENAHLIKNISSAALKKEKIGVAITHEITAPPWPVTLWLRPKNLVLGVGCKKGIAGELLAAAAGDFMRSAGIAALSIACLASIDIKAQESAIIAYAYSLNVPFMTFSAEILNDLEGDFCASARVKAVTGVDNVCERAAIKAALSLGSEAALMRSKTKYEGITLALARIIA